MSLVRWGVFSLSETPDEPLETPALGASYVRGATWAEFELNENKRHVFMLNTHLDTKSDAVRKKELEIILARIAFYNKENLPTFMTADFNANAQNSIFYDTSVRDSYLLAREQAPSAISIRRRTTTTERRALRISTTSGSRISRSRSTPITW